MLTDREWASGMIKSTAEGKEMDMRDKLLDYNTEFDNDDRYEANHQIEMLVMNHNKLELIAEDLEAAHLWLDDKNVPRHETVTEAEYSIVGRIMQYKAS